ncbi:hypothetical protein [Microlunatus sp. GCM10028923]|uniref:hypothetical protein n=1 Tax=Microlunatus sp. GCM10028923 TaxID=3273400 RepID=UPI00360D14E4
MTSWSQVHPDRPATTIDPDLDTLLRVLETARQDADWSDRTGTGLRLIGTDPAGWRLELSGLAGGSPEVLLQSFVITVEAPDDRAAGLADDWLAPLASSWDPDFGDVTDDDVLDALEDAGWSVGDPVIGRVGYLSPSRAALVPDALSAESLPDGGVVLRLTDATAVVDAYQRLRDLGALDPLPRPMTRARL